MALTYYPYNSTEFAVGFVRYPGYNLLNTILCSVYILRVALYPLRLTPKPHGKNCISKHCCPYIADWEVKYYYYSKEVTDGKQIQQFPDSKYGEDLLNVRFKPEWPTVFLIHGWAGGFDVTAPRIIKDAYLRRPDNHNVIVVDWGGMSSALFYYQATVNTRTTGQNLAHFILNNLANKRFEISKIHVLGFSLGAQVAAFAGKTIKANRKKLPRITGIDPAYPDFEHRDCINRICSTDADFVDIIHSDNNILGLGDYVGQLDFYVNGGTGPQPDCGKFRLDSPAHYAGVLVFPCSHLTGPIIYAQTVIDPKKYIGTPWHKDSPYPLHSASNSTVCMGFGAINSKGLNGTYYVNARFLDKQSPWDFIYGGTV